MRMQVPLGKPQPWVLPVTVVCLALGAGIALELISAKEPTDPSKMRPEQLAIYYAQAKKENIDLQKALNDIRTQHDKDIQSMTDAQKVGQALQKEIDNLRIQAGTCAVEGPGIVVTIDDTNVIKPNLPDLNSQALVVHDTDLLLLVNELRSAGAEAISINDQRIIAATAIRCAGPDILINNRPISPPFTIRAIGKTDTLYGAVNLPFGVLDQLKPMNIHVDVAKRDKLHVPAAVIVHPMEFGKPVISKDNTLDEK